LHRIVTGDEKWIFFDNPKRKESWVSPGEAVPSTSRHNRFGRKTMLCVWWDHRGVVYYELLKPGETVNGERYQQQLINLNYALIEKRPDWARRHGRVILLHDNAPSRTVTHHEAGQRHLVCVEVGRVVSPAVLSRFGSFRLPLVPVDGAWIG